MITDKKILASKKVLKRLESQKEKMPLYKLCRQFGIYESEFRYIVRNNLNAADQLSNAMKKRKSKVFSIAKKSGTAFVEKLNRRNTEKHDQGFVSDFKINETAKTVERFECQGCGQVYIQEPVICNKCNGLHFKIVNIPVQEGGK
ncbi:MAG TPA: hypothetical protein DCP47_06235 [Phycisphaerales bacterium]|nr:hypothetical protein [Phycisphaerales bacterium]